MLIRFRTKEPIDSICNALNLAIALAAYIGNFYFRDASRAF
jgi:hypothetical protein